MIRRMSMDDLSRVVEISVFGWRMSYKDIIDDKILFSKNFMAKRLEVMKEYIGHEVLENYVYDDGIIKGILTMGPCRDQDKKSEETFECCGLYVEPMLCGEGIGGKLIAYCEKEARRKKYKEVILWTFEKNKRARAFYEKHGFVAEGKKDQVLGAIDMRYIKYLE